MSCQKCGSDIILEVSAKCYDMCHLSYRQSETTAVVPNNIGLGKDPNCVSFSYCLNCGQIQGEYPIQLPEMFRPVLQPPKIEEELLSDYIQEFYNNVMSKTDRMTVSLMLNKIVQYLQPTDAYVFSSAWTKFEELRKIHPQMPEFDETVTWVMHKYQNVKMSSMKHAY